MSERTFSLLQLLQGSADGANRHGWPWLSRNNRHLFGVGTIAPLREPPRGTLPKATGGTAASQGLHCFLTVEQKNTHALWRTPARQASFEDNRYLLHNPLLFTKPGLSAFSTAACFWRRWKEGRSQHTLCCPRTAQNTQTLLFR